MGVSGGFLGKIFGSVNKAAGDEKEKTEKCNDEKCPQGLVFWQPDEENGKNDCNYRFSDEV